MESFRKIDMFAPLDRGKEEDITLHIVPVATALRRETTVYVISGEQQESYEEAFVPTLAATGGSNGEYVVSGTIEEIIKGEGSVTKTERSDRIQVLFCDGVEQQLVRVDVSGYRDVLWRKRTGRWITTRRVGSIGLLHLNQQEASTLDSCTAVGHRSG